MWEIEGLVSDRDRVDEMSEERGVAKMSCGHWLGRENMKLVIDYQIRILKNYQVQCPCLSEVGSFCGKNLDIRICALVAGLTRK